MSLVGSLEDLDLGDILQIIHLSRKSGALRLQTEVGEGQILFREGLIATAFRKGGPTDLREVLAAQEVADDSTLDAAAEYARARGHSLDETLLERGVIDADALETARRSHAEDVVLCMFSWRSGEFSFEVRMVQPSEGGELFIEPGLNPQFLALEGTRQFDESEHGLTFDGEADADTGATPEVVDGDFVDPLGDMTLESVDAEPLDELPPELPAEEVDPAADVVSATIEDEAEVVSLTPEEEVAAPVPAEEAPPAVAAGPPPPMIVIDSSLPVLEWVKTSLEAADMRIHVFQTSELGISRIRQYLARRELPLVLISADAPADSLSGARDTVEIVSRLRAQAPRMRVMVMSDEDDGSDADRVRKPSIGELSDPRAAEQRIRLGRGLCAALQIDPDNADPAGSAGSARSAGSAAEDAEAAASVDALRATSARIRDPGATGEVLSEVLDFAGRGMRRVALFMVREGTAVGLAQRGLDAAGGPDDARFHGLELSIDASPWLRSVLETRAASRPGAGDGDPALAEFLGGAPPAEAFLAPIESSGHVVALVYGDMLPSADPLPNTGALEVVLHQAGLALDRATLERVLGES